MYFPKDFVYLLNFRIIIVRPKYIISQINYIWTKAFDKDDNLPKYTLNYLFQIVDINFLKHMLFQ